MPSRDSVKDLNPDEFWDLAFRNEFSDLVSQNAGRHGDSTDAPVATRAADASPPSSVSSPCRRPFRDIRRGHFISVGAPVRAIITRVVVVVIAFTRRFESL